MSEQVNPTPEEQDEMAESALETAPVSAAPPEAPSRPAARREPAIAATRESDGRSRDDGGEEYDEEFEDDEDEDEEEGGEGDQEERYVSGPAEYVQREKSGRGRRIGSEVRPEDVDYKNVPLLSRFLDRRGRILSRRKTRVSAKVQRRIVKAIKRARLLALLPYTAEQTRIVRRRR
jgi:small subunit ribosomal protein S18